MTPIEASTKSNESEKAKKFRNKRGKKQPKNEVRDLVKASELRKSSSKGDTKNSNYEIYTNAKIVENTISSKIFEKLSQKTRGHNTYNNKMNKTS